MTAVQPQRSIPLTAVAWLTALVPLITIHVSFLLSAYQGHVPWCLPWFEGCTSISRAARSGTAYFIYKGFMLPTCLIMAVFWLANHQWLRSLGARPGRLLWLGVLAAFFLAMYSVALGHGGEPLNLMRRIGVVGFFGFTYLAQLSVSASLLATSLASHGRNLLALSGFTLAVGVVSVILTVVWPEQYSRMDDGFEWSLAVLINLHTLYMAVLWQRTQFAVSFHSSG